MTSEFENFELESPPLYDSAEAWQMPSSAYEVLDTLTRPRTVAELLALKAVQHQVARPEDIEEVIRLRGLN